MSSKFLKHAQIRALAANAFACTKELLIWHIQTIQIRSLPGALQDWCKLLSQHHVALDLQLATHECLHTIQLALCHGFEILICQCDCYVCLVLAPLHCTSTVLQVEVKLVVPDDQLEHGICLLHKLCTFGLHGIFDLLKDGLGHCKNCWLVKQGY